MKNYNGYGYVVNVEVPLGSEIFDVQDGEYATHEFCNLPPDFELHLGYALLEKETCPPELLQPVKEWIRTNKKVIK
jgi:hypothetical protein